jgi:hypothetical protein
MATAQQQPRTMRDSLIQAGLVRPDPIKAALYSPEKGTDISVKTTASGKVPRSSLERELFNELTQLRAAYLKLKDQHRDCFPPSHQCLFCRLRIVVARGLHRAAMAFFPKREEKQ